MVAQGGHFEVWSFSAEDIRHLLGATFCPPKGGCIQTLAAYISKSIIAINKILSPFCMSRDPSKCYYQI